MAGKSSMTRLLAKLAALSWASYCIAGTQTARASEIVEPAPIPAESQIDKQSHEQSRRIFEFGVQLFQEGNLVGALAQFEAAYAVHPNSAALQNIALCQKGLYRYREAKASLSALLLRHPGELSAQDKKTALTVIGELAAFVGQQQITVRPESSRVTIDDQEYTPSELSKPIELNVGEHRLRIEAPGYAPTQRTLAIAGGVGNAPIHVALVPTHGYLTVLTPDDRTAIAIDGHAVAFESYRGFIEPGRHVIQIYRSGFEPYEAVVELDAGQSVTVRGKVGAPVSAPEADEPPEPPSARGPSPRQLSGWYGLVEGSILNWNGAPQDIEPTKNSVWGTGYGLRAGYRLFTPVGVEAVAGVTHHNANGSCDASFALSPNCQTILAPTYSSPTHFDYTLDTRRAGGAVRIMSGGESIRFTSSVGVGAVSHDLHLPKHTLKGFDAYFALEAGAQINIHHFLVEMVGFGWFDSASSIGAGNYKPYQEGNGIQMFGVSLRVGWSEWTPRDAHLHDAPGRP